MATRLVVVDDHPVVRLGLVQVLGLEGDLQVVADAGSAEDALPRIDASVDLVVTDLRMVGLDGLALTRLVKATHPFVAVLMLSSFDESLFAEQALDAGASGYVMKDAAPERIHDAVRQVAAGRVALSDTMWDRLLPVRTSDPVELTDGERALMAALAEGPTSDVGLRLRLGGTLRELEALRRSTMAKLGLSTPVELLLRAQWAARG